MVRLEYHCRGCHLAVASAQYRLIRMCSCDGYPGKPTILATYRGAGSAAWDMPLLFEFELA